MPDEIEDAINGLEMAAAEVSETPIVDAGQVPETAIEWKNEEWGSVGSDGGVIFVKDADVEVSDKDLRSAFAGSPELRVLEPWVRSIATSNRRRRGGLFERDKYAGAKGVFEQFKVAREAAENDDIVSNILETTEALILNKVRIECADDDEEDVWNQISRNMNLDARFREMWRELFTYSQYYVAIMWGNKTFKLDGKGPQRARRKTYNLKVPSAISLLDPMKVIPVGDFLFGKDKLVYVANRTESTNIDDVIAGANTSDQVVLNLLVEKYNPSREERSKIAEVVGHNIDLSNLYVLNPHLVWRHTATHPSYTRFAPVRMKSVFELLDLKHQLREMDRTRLLGSTNFIILVRKGSKEHPATSGELASLNTSVRTVAQTPLIVGDHRLTIDMITPDMDMTLDPARYNTIDSRITARLYQIFHLGNFCLTSDTEVMTDSGWKFYHEIQDGDRAYSVDPNTNEGRFANIEAVNVFDHNGPMHRIRTRRLDVLSTPNHRWYTQYDPSVDKSAPDRHRFVTSSALGLTDRIPLRFEPGDLPVAPTHKDQLVRLLAWYMTEGCRRYEYPNGKRCFIAQSRTANPEKVERIAADLAALWGEPGFVENGGLWHYDGITFSIAAEVGHEIVDLCPGRVKVPSYEFINSLTYDQLHSFVDVCIDGDGHREKSGRRTFYSKDTEIVDLFEYCAVKLGISVTRTAHFTYHVDSQDRDETIWKVNLGFNSHANPARAVDETVRNGSATTMDYVHYTGKVWCPTTSTGTWVARRNGRVFYTGNSAGTGKDDSLKLIRVVARGLESRRQMIKENLERNLLHPIFEANDSLKCRPSIQFTPRSIALDFDANFLQIMMDLYYDGAISRDTILGVVDHRQEDEFFRREVEAEKYDKVMAPRGTPPGRKAGLLGGNNNGGGMNPDSVKPNPRPRRNENDIPTPPKRV